MSNINRETWHFDLRHLCLDQPFMLRLQGRDYEIAPHTETSRAEAIRANMAFGLLDASRMTHYAENVAAPECAVAFWYVTAPRLGAEDGLDRLILTGIHVPRGERVKGISAGRERKIETLRTTGRVLGPQADTLLQTVTDDQIADIATFKDAMDAAVSLIFHHPELMALHPKPADQILRYICTASGLNALASSILSQAQIHEQDSTQPNWVVSRPGTNATTGEPSAPIYVWSDETLEWLGLPLRDTLVRTKNDLALKGQCWTVQQGITEVNISAAPSLNAAILSTEVSFTLKQLAPEVGVLAAFTPESNTGGTFTLTNSYLRWLQVSVDQYDVKGYPVGNMQRLGWVAPVDTIIAIPLPPQPTDFAITFHPEAHRVVVSFGGIGQEPFDVQRDIIGIVLTSIFNLAIPAAFIVIGVAVDQFSNWSDIQKKVVDANDAVIEAFAQGPIAGAVAGGSSLEDLLATLGNIAGSLLLQLLASKTSAILNAFFAEANAEGAVEKEVAWIGWVAQAIGAAADIASISETIAHVAGSPATMSVEIVRTMNVCVTINNDPNHEGHFPETATEYVITLTYDDGPAYTYHGAMDATTQASPIVHTFPSLPAGGSLTVLACFYSSTGWLAGKGQLQSVVALPSQGNDTLILPSFSIKEYLVPLTASTTYGLKEKLASRDGKHIWVSPQDGGSVTATESDLSRSPIGNNLGSLASLGLNEPLSAIGYLYEASGENIPLANTADPYSGQLFVYQNVSDNADPESGLKQCTTGHVYKTLLAYPPPTAVNPVADGFLMEPVDTVRSSMYLRKLSLAPGEPFLLFPNKAFGRFTGPQDDLAIHPSGYAVALSKEPYCKLQILRLGVLFLDADAPVARIRGGQGTRSGLLSQPVALSCGLSTVFVLQTSPDHPQGAIVAFDLNGNPVSCFAGVSVAPLRDEGAANVVVLDISVEGKGFLYVLKYLNPVSILLSASDYRLDIYNPDGSFLTQVPGISAARLQVDLWRNLYTLTYEIVQGTARTEPSIALWIPSTPS